MKLSYLIPAFALASPLTPVAQTTSVESAPIEIDFPDWIIELVQNQIEADAVDQVDENQLESESSPNRNERSAKAGIQFPVNQGTIRFFDKQNRHSSTSLSIQK